MQVSQQPDYVGALDKAPASTTSANEICRKRKPGEPRKRALSPQSPSSWPSSDTQPAPKRGPGRPRIRPLQDTRESKARRRRAGSTERELAARNAARGTARQALRQPRSLSDPYKVLCLKRCETDTSLIRAAYPAAQMSCSDMLPFPAQLGEDPSSGGHRRLRMVSDAHTILEDRRMKTLLDKCLNHHYKKQTGSAVDILDIVVCPVHARPTEQDVEQAYNDRMTEWSGFEEVAGIVVKILRAARDTVLEDLRRAQDEEEKLSRGGFRVERRDSFMEDDNALEDDEGA